MVLLSAAICNKSGKGLLSRQFVEMSRSRAEGLLAAFPKLMSNGKQHTFVETESVRYVYQPLEKLFVLLITTKNSNILEDLETLRLFSRVVPEYCGSLDEKDVLDNAYEVIFAFDEIVALGYRESVNLSQVRTYIEMESHEENVYQAVRKSQEKEAHEAMKKKAKEIAQQKKEREKMNRGKGGTSNMSSLMSGTSRLSPDVPMVGDTTSSVSTSSSKPQSTFTSSSRPSGSSRALKLGGKDRDLNTFVDKLKAEGTGNYETKFYAGSIIFSYNYCSSNSRYGLTLDVIASTAKHSIASANKPEPPTSNVIQSGIHLKLEEKINLQARQDGSLETMEVLGNLILRISDADKQNIHVWVKNDEDRDVQTQTHPHVDRKFFAQKSIIASKSASKPFPLNNDVPVLRWRYQTSDSSQMPLSINLWPSYNNGMTEVNVEYELEQEDLTLNDVNIVIPIPHGSGSPVVKEVDGDYDYDNGKSCLIWSLPVMDASNKDGSLEFTVAGDQSDFFPISLSFYSPNLYCRLSIAGVKAAESGKDITDFSSEMFCKPDRYLIGNV
ncbi:uncharacterized protein TRIADDRAFT_61957 [Trichoplax adhaerens]|uniref:Coatomer subunit delta n=1 Tax=Trichoplax adhaerens TaxID=10228 RepID=B3SCF9_TRIAD|nr:hypothetical protein TRIADDRAFT_61957 [Trichoplax adhaerens]EDV19588.1 hypothetical protein TRIADDRAFT_61957 [Trichoplax adhaerens]|eukprot:XP_002117921.1 hypothetical protein TRIADDRAFT_61957 [Trichoplax adhaerens]